MARTDSLTNYLTDLGTALREKNRGKYGYDQTICKILQTASASVYSGYAGCDHRCGGRPVLSADHLEYYQ